MERDLGVKTSGEESGTGAKSRVSSILAPLMNCHSSAVLQFKETQKNVSSYLQKMVYDYNRP